MRSVPPWASAHNSLNVWWSSSRSFLCMVIFPKPLYRRALAQAFEPTIEVVAYVAKWLMKLFADLSQFHPFEIKQLQSLSLHVRQIFKCALQLREIESGPDLAFYVVLSQ